MNCRERTLCALWRTGPDRIPFSYHINPAVMLKYGPKVLEMARRYPNDYYDVTTLKMPERDLANTRPDGTYYKEQVNAWGCRWRFLEQGISGEVMNQPLADWSDLETFHCPPVDNSQETRAKLRKSLDDQERAGYIRWGGAGNFFERMQWLRGVENFFMDVALYPEEVAKLADKMMEEHLIPQVEMALEAKADVIQFSDDWGTQEALLINPKSFREIFKPCYEKMFRLAGQNGALVWLHSDGMILEIIPDLIEIGLNVINPQGNCMDLKELRRITQGRISIFMDTDRQQRLPFGTPEQIDSYVKYLAEIFGDPQGGFSFTGAFDAQMPLDNIEACMKAFQTYSKFPAK